MIRGSSSSTSIARLKSTFQRVRCERIARARAFASAADGNPRIVPWVDLFDDFATHAENIVRGNDSLLGLNVGIRPKRIGRRLEEAVRLRRLTSVDRSANDLADDRALK